MFKQVTFKPKGMQRDLSKTSFNKEYAYEIKNMRLNVNEEGTLGSITNEIGPKEINVKSKDGNSNIYIWGTPLGQAVIDNTYIFFTHYDGDGWDDSEITDYIYKIWQEDNVIKGEILYSGNLNFSLKHPIETLAYYENNTVRKVYWTDNYNQPRLINIDKNYKEKVQNDIEEINRYDDTVFDFIPTLKLKEDVVIEKINTSDGQFPAGIVQYSFTYFDLYGHESNIFYTSPLYYISFLDRGGNGEEKIGNAFKITIKSVDTRFDYLRVYCTLRTSIDSNVITRKVKDIKLKPSGNILTEVSLVDDGIIGEDVEDYSLFFRGGTPITVKTLNQKDNTLFVGNIKETSPILDSITVSNIQNLYKEAIQYDYVEATYKYIKRESNGKPIIPTVGNMNIDLPELNSYYPWNSSLQYNSSTITTFKTGEIYRFGLQFQHKTGKWSEVVWLNDCENTKVREQDFANNTTHKYDTKVYKTIAKFDASKINDTQMIVIINELVNKGYIKVRPVIVYPSLADRNILCQGVLCPTVFNVNDRKTNAPFAQSSWFIRPNLPKDFGTNVGNLQNDNPLKGSFPEFRHYYPLPANTQRNAEIQCNDIAPNTPLIQKQTGETFEVASNKFVSYFKDNFYVDQSIVTFHSPDIEFDDNLKNIDFSLFKLRIVGVVPITAHSSDIDITAGSTLGLYNKDTLGTGFFKYTPKACTTPLSGINIAANPSRALLSGTYWIDGVARKKNDKVGTDYLSITANQRAYVVYPWHREISLNNDSNYANYEASAKIKHKRISNFYSSYDSLYLDKSSYYNIDINDAKLFDSNEISLVKLHSPIPDEEDIVYYGNVDRVIAPSVDKVPNIYSIGARDKSDGYNIMISNTYVGEDGSDAQTAFTDKYITLKENWPSGTATPVYKVNDPIHIKYKSTPHVVLSTKGSKSGSNYIVNILPTITTAQGNVINSAVMNRTFNSECFWDEKILNITQGEIKSKWGTTVNTSTQSTKDILLNSELTPNPDTPTIKIDRTLQYGFLWLAELYRDTVYNRFGGTDANALAQNNWLVAGEPLMLMSKNSNNETIYNLNDIKWTAGDTYYQRYDHIKTYPFTTEDTNSISEVVSFMCETRINLDGRCDKNRLYYNNLIITPEKFNLMNDVYNQKDTYFTYHTLDYNKNTTTEYANTISWGNTKVNGANIDSWTNINLAASLELDGNLGPVNSIKKYNNDIIVFQDKGVSVISYNENVQISSTAGVPIEILNSGKVTGKRYISNTLGSVNKWSICETPLGIVFIDDNAKNIYIYDGQIKNISDTKGFNSWVREHSNLNEWNPLTFDNYVTYYDNINNEILFIGKDDCLVYSLKLGEFTSFYNYNHVPYFFNLYDKGIFLYKDWNISLGNYALWEEHAGLYNEFFKKPAAYSIEVIVNEEPTKDKIFNNIEYNADTWDKEGLSNITFNTIECYNDYQKGTATLSTEKYKPSILKRKFRTWRIQVPRDNTFKQDRIRDTWMGLKLIHNDLDYNKMILHDITVTYNSN